MYAQIELNSIIQRIQKMNEFMYNKDNNEKKYIKSEWNSRNKHYGIPVITLLEIFLNVKLLPQNRSRVWLYLL